MEPNLVNQQLEPNMPFNQGASHQEVNGFQNDPVIKNFIAQSQKRGRKSSCFVYLILIVIFILIIIFGNQIFGFFHIANIYHFIVSLVIIFLVYIIALTLSGFFIKYPKDLLSITIDRLKD